MPFIKAICTPDPDKANGGFAPSALLVSSVGEALRYLERHHDRRVVVFFTRPDRRLAEALARGIPLEAALAECRDQIDALLDIVRRDRRRVILVEQSAAHSDPEGFAAALYERLGKEFPDIAALEPSISEQPDALALALARLALLEGVDLRRRCAELEASALNSATANGQIEARAAVEEFLDLKREAGRADDLSNLADENRTVIEQLFRVERDLEAALRKQGDEREKHKRVVAELDRVLAELDRVRAKTKAGEQRERNAKERLAAVYASTSWRLTAPLRMLGGLLKRSEDGKGP